MKLGRLVISIACWLLASAPAWPAVYGAGGDSALWPGANFDPRDLTRSFPPCMAHSGKEWQTEASDPLKPTAISTEFSVKVVESRTELLETLRINVAASAQYGIFKAGASYGRDFSSSFDESSLLVALRGEIDWGTWRRTGKLDPQYLNMLNGTPQGLEAFIQSCGLEYVDRTRRGILGVVLFQFYSLDKQTKDRITKTIGAGVKGPKFGGDVQGRYDRFVSEARFASNLKVHVVTRGGPGEEVLAPLTRDYKNVDTVTKILADYFDDKDPQKAAPVSYYSGQLASYAEGRMPAIVVDDYLTFLGSLWEAAGRLYDRLDRANTDIRHADDYPLTQTERGGLLEHSAVLVERIAQLRVQAEKCRSAYGLFNGRNRAAAVKAVNKSCLVKGETLLVPPYPLSGLHSRGPVSVTHYIDALTGGQRLLVVTVEGQTLRNAYLRTPAVGAKPAMRHDVLKLLQRNAGRVAQGALALQPGWDVVEVVSEMDSGNEYIKVVSTAESTALQPTMATAAAQESPKGQNAHRRPPTPIIISVPGLKAIQKAAGQTASQP